MQERIPTEVTLLRESEGQTVRCERCGAVLAEGEWLVGVSIGSTLFAEGQFYERDCCKSKLIADLRICKTHGAALERARMVSESIARSGFDELVLIRISLSSPNQLN